MTCATPSACELYRPDTATGIAIPRGWLLVLTAGFATAIWAAMLHLAGFALGVSMGASWMTAVLAVIFVLLLLGLSMAALSTDDSGGASR